MFLSDISIKRPIMMTMFLLIFILFGGIAYFSLDLNLMPDVNVPYVTVTTVYPGAGPKEIETQVTKKIEDAVSTVSQVKSLTSYSLEGASLVQIEFDLDKDIDIANQEVKDKVDAIKSDLPDDTKQPMIQKFEIGAKPVIDLVLSGKISPTKLYELADKTLKDRFSQIRGVASVNLVGGQEREVSVELNDRTVIQNKISLLQLSQILTAENLDIPGGSFKIFSQEYSTRVKGKYNSLDELKDVDIPTVYGKKKLGNLASVSDNGKEVKVRSTYFNNVQKNKEENVVILSIIKSSDGNTVKMAKDIVNLLPEIKSELPEGINLDLVNNASTFIEASVEDTLSNIGMGVVLTALVLLFFLHDLRSTLIAALSMPFSIISTFMALQLSGYSLNVMTLMGLSTSVGILVANSIVVLENIFRHKELGHNKKDSAAKGTAEVVVAVLASAMTNIVVFLPLANMSSLVGSFFKEFALTVTYATVFSIIVSFTLTPMLAALILPEKSNKKSKIGSALEKMFKRWENTYAKMLAIVIKNRVTSFVTIIGAVLMFFGSFYFAGKLSFSFFPRLDEGNINIEVELPQGYNLNETAQLLNKTEKRIVEHPEVKQVLTQLGEISQMDKGTNMALMKIKLVDAEKRAISTNEMVSSFIQELSDIPNAMYRISAVSSVGSGQSAIRFYLKGDNINKLEELKNQLVPELNKVPGLTNLNTSSRSGKPEITLYPDRRKLTDAGLTVYDLAMTLRASVEGLTTTRFNDNGEEYDIRIKLSDESVDTPEKIADIPVISKRGVYKLRQLAEVNFTEGFSRILHRDKSKTILFSGDVGQNYALGDIVNGINNTVEAANLPAGYSAKWTGDSEMMKDAIFDMGFAFILALILTYMLLAAILESITQPLMILGTIPLALIGVFAGLYFSGLDLSVMAMLAIVMLIGIVVNNAILIMDYANQLIKEGKSVKDALLIAAPVKLKPILMSTIAIILGMLPMAMGIGSAGKEFRQPIGVVSIGGLIASGILTLFVIPAVFELTHKTRKEIVKG